MEREKPSKKEFWAYFNQDDDFYMGLSDIGFRTCFHARIHHNLEIQVNHALNTGTKFYPKRIDLMYHWMELWDKKGLSHDLPEYRFAEQMFRMAFAFEKGIVTDLAPFAPKRLTEEEQKAYDDVLYSMHETHVFNDEPVSDEDLDAIVDAALWAANGGNLQPLRFMIIHESAAPGLFEESTAKGAPVHLVVCYETEGRHALAAMGGRKDVPEESFFSHRNSPLDAGSALMNIELAAAACGLSYSRQTMTNEIKARLRERFKTPDTLHPLYYVELGYSDEPALRLPRPAVRDTVWAVI